MQNHADGSEEQLYHRLVDIRTFACDLAGQRTTPTNACMYEAVSSLVAAAEAMMEGIVDERTIVALDVLAEVVGADLAAAPTWPPAPRQVQSA